MTEHSGEWYWCLDHRRAEQGKVCPEKVRMGPYRSAEEAANWREKAKERNERWQDEDARWERGA
ncbi:MAG: hypothetical protein ACRDYX_14025 [Egibacteraceae bacterium]